MADVLPGIYRMRYGTAPNPDALDTKAVLRAVHQSVYYGGWSDPFAPLAELSALAAALLTDDNEHRSVIQLLVGFGAFSGLVVEPLQSLNLQTARTIYDRLIAPAVRESDDWNSLTRTFWEPPISQFDAQHIAKNWASNELRRSFLSDEWAVPIENRWIVADLAIIAGALSALSRTPLSEEIYLTLKATWGLWITDVSKIERRRQPKNRQNIGNNSVALESLVGLPHVKAEVLALRQHLELRSERIAAGITAGAGLQNLVFTGNPGTGKTTVARIVAGVYADLGLLPTADLVETDRSGLVAEYVGQTAIKTAGVIEKAIGGVLFIDEAYSLTRSSGLDALDYGIEAVDTLVKMMEDFRDDLVVIVAGYPTEMSQFLSSNPGLESRFAEPWQFDNYSASELIRLLELMLEKQGYNLGSHARSELLRHFEAQCQVPNFGNARYVRRLVERAQVRQSVRLSRSSRRTPEQLRFLDADDFIFIPRT